MDTCPIIGQDFRYHPYSSIWDLRLKESRAHGVFGPDSERLSECKSIKLSGGDFGQWRHSFGSMTSLRQVELFRASQEMFDAICAISSLERLRIESSKITDIDRLVELPKLTHLVLMHKSSVTNTAPLKHCHQLSSLCLDTKFGVFSKLDFLEQNEKLEGLQLHATRSFKEGYDSLQPIRNCASLKFLAFCATIEDRSLSAILGLKQLKYIWLQRWHQWTRRDYVELVDALPNLVASKAIGWAVHDEKFCRQHRISVARTPS